MALGRSMIENFIKCFIQTGQKNRKLLNSNKFKMIEMSCPPFKGENLLTFSSYSEICINIPSQLVMSRVLHYAALIVLSSNQCRSKMNESDGRSKLIGIKFDFLMTAKPF